MVKGICHIIYPISIHTALLTHRITCGFHNIKSLLLSFVDSYFNIYNNEGSAYEHVTLYYYYEN